MIDVVQTNGEAYEYHDDGTWVDLGGGVQDAKAGQGESFVLQTDGQLLEHKDNDQNWWYLDSNVSAIDAGTDRYGVNAVVEITTGDYAREWSDSTGWHDIAGNVRQASAGRQDIVNVVFSFGDAY